MSSSGFLGTDRFTVRRRLGAGGMGVVYEAYDRLWQQTVALKTLVRADPSAIYRLKTEFRSLADVSHPNLVSLYDLFIEDDVCFFTMEFVDGVDFITYVNFFSSDVPADTPTLPISMTLEEVTLQHPAQPAAIRSAPVTNRAPLTADLGRLRTSLRQLSEGLCALHESNKLHRDIKPSNVMVTKQGRVAILDFGLTTELAKPNLMHTLKFAGTPAYMSPEQGLDQPLTRASDWYGVGVTLYQSLTGRLPFPEGDFVQLMLNKQTLEPVPPSDIVEGVPEDLDSLCCALLRRDPQARPSGREVLQSLGATAAADATRFEGALAPDRRLPFVGREQELRQLRDAFAATKSGRTLRVYIQGNSGMGKSALIRRFLEDLQRNEKVIVLEGRCYERESVPYKALDGIIDSLSRCLRSMPRKEAAALIPKDVHALSRLFPVMLRVEAVADAPYPFEKTPDPLSLRSRACNALRELFARISNRQPLVLFIDDLQWADADSTALIEDLLRAPAEPSLLLLISLRSEEAHSTAFLKTFLERADPKHCRELTIGPLSAAESSQFVEAMLDSSELPAQSVTTIVREGGGSPFFLEQLARWTAANSDTAGAPNISLGEMLNGRIAPLPEGARSLLETLAIAAAPLDAEVACIAAGIESGTRPLITALRVANLIRSTGVTNRLEIYHDRIREFLSSAVEPGDTARIHLALAKALESKGLDDPEALFEHNLRGGERDRAANYAVLAAQKSTDALAFDRAAMFYRQALDLASRLTPEPLALRAGLAEALANAGRPAEAARVYLDAAREADAAQSLDFQRRAAEQLLMGGHVDEGRKVIQNVLSTFGLHLASGPRRALYSFLVRRIQLLLRGLRFDERETSEIPADQVSRIDICWAVAVGLSMVDSIRSSDFQTRHLLLALRAGEPYRIARALAMEAGFSALPGGAGVKRSSLYLERAEKLSKKVNNPHAVALTTLLAGVCAFLVGKWGEAARLSDEARGMLRDKCTGVFWELTSADTFLLGSLMYLGEYRVIADRFGAMLAAAEERGNLYASTELRTRMNFVWLVEDKPEKARKELAEAMHAWSHEGFHRQHYNCLLSQAHIELYTGNAAAARELVAKQWPNLRRAMLLRIQVLRIEAFFLRARTILAAGGSDGLGAAEALAGRITREKMPWSDPLALLIRAGVANLRGQRDKASTLLSQAAEEFHAAGMEYHAMAARRQLGLLSSATERDRLIAEADTWMTAKGIRNPARFTHMWAPGFSEAAGEPARALTASVTSSAS